MMRRYFNQSATTKLCARGRGLLMTGENSRFNARDENGKQVCAECVLDAIKNSPRRSAMIRDYKYEGPVE